MIVKILFSLFVFCYLIILLILVFILVCGESRYNKFSKYVLVLGARIIDEDTPCKTLEKRLLCAVDYLNEFQESKVIVSGGRGEDEPVSEGFAMKKFLINMGIDVERILIESSSTNTFENLKNTKKILGDIDEILIITSKYHLFRAKILARRVGFKSIHLIGSETFYDKVWKDFFREIIAVIKSILFDW